MTDPLKRRFILTVKAPEEVLWVHEAWERSEAIPALFRMAHFIGQIKDKFGPDASQMFADAVKAGGKVEVVCERS